MSNHETNEPTSGGPFPGPRTSRPVISGTRGIISSGHYLTSMAGMRMMVSGGNAFDAVAAGVFAGVVVEPTAACSLAAESVFMLYDARSGDLKSLSGQGVAPGRATAEFYRSNGLDVIPTGPGPLAPLSFTVPGVVHATISMLSRYGTKSLSEVMAPAIQYAEEGVPHYRQMIDFLGLEPTIRQFRLFPPGGSEVFYDGGRLPEEGSLFFQPGLAETLRSLAAAEAASKGSRSDRLRAGIDEFYRGRVARQIADASASVGGVLGYEDLTAYRSQFEEPLRTTFSGYEICGQRTWSQAGILLQTLNMLEHFDLRAMGHNTPAYIHTVIEALKLSMADRQTFYGDPDFADVPTDQLLSKDYAAARAALIDPNGAVPELPPPGNPRGGGPLTERPVTGGIPAGGSSGKLGQAGGTTHVAAIDRAGNMACATPSGGSFEKSVFFPELGCALSTRSEVFNLSSGHPNVVEPGKRPRTTLVNYIAVKDGVPQMTFGCPGGDHQTQANLQLMLNTFIFGMNPQEAIEAPRFATDSVPDSFYPHNYYPGRLSLEAGIPSGTAGTLERLGHRVVRAEVCGVGATVTHRDPESGVLSTGGDPRRPCYALSW
ncbi:MAG: gamma-glutamyltransferase [bacterium]|nr:gamma-glutamyltransferase [bacterium]MDE0602602.1 gamma-glutamyltransferase [bacterium]